MRELVVVSRALSRNPLFFTSHLAPLGNDRIRCRGKFLAITGAVSSERDALSGCATAISLFTGGVRRTCDAVLSSVDLAVTAFALLVGFTALCARTAGLSGALALMFVRAGLAARWNALPLMTALPRFTGRPV